MNAWRKLPPGALEATIRDHRRRLKPGETHELHDVACPLQVGEACNCEPIVVTSEEAS